MLRGDSRSLNLGSTGGVNIGRLTLFGPRVDDGTTLPETDRPFAPNGTGGFLTPIFRMKGKRERTTFNVTMSLNSVHSVELAHATETWYSIPYDFTSMFQFLLSLTIVLFAGHGHIFRFGT